MVRLGDEPTPPATGVPTATMSVLPEGEAPVPAPVPPAEWTVEPGDSFWSIAEEVVADELGRRPSDAEVAAYWRLLIETNRDRLVTADPDLIHPGQVFTLPPR
jgi:nucleoid-associated protein YgaU